jgi:hypothetical protein
VKQGAISIIWYSTSDMLGDILAKFSLPSSVFLKHDRYMLSGTYSALVPSWGVLVPPIPMRAPSRTDIPHPVP